LATAIVPLAASAARTLVVLSSCALGEPTSARGYRPARVPA
jgi:hypothetical protein